MNKEQKAHELALLASKFYIDINFQEYSEIAPENRFHTIISDLSSAYDEAYNQIIEK